MRSFKAQKFWSEEVHGWQADPRGEESLCERAPEDVFGFSLAGFFL